MADVEQMLIDIRFYEQIVGDARRTIFCQPSVAAAVQEAVDAVSVGHLYTVRVSPACPEGKLIVIDEQAIEATLQAVAQRSLRRP